jgi:hypothetical protein
MVYPPTRQQLDTMQIIVNSHEHLPGTTPLASVQACWRRSDATLVGNVPALAGRRAR